MSLFDVVRVFVVRRVSCFRALLVLIVFLGIVAGASQRLFAQVAQAPSWAEPSLSGGPSARYGAAMAYDAATGQVVLFGGFATGSFFNDTWIWNGSSWTQQTPPSSPSGRYFSTMAYDAATGQVVLFGGTGSSLTGLGDTWTWNGSTWTQQRPSSSPPARYGSAMAYDASSGQLVLFGGNSNGSIVGDTWTWNGSTWTQQNPSSSPPIRSNTAMAYDAASGQVVLFGGFGSGFGEIFGDTWTWNESTWTQQIPPSSPSGRYASAMAYDAASGQVVLFGGVGPLGDTWTWNGSTWTQQTPSSSPPARAFASMAYDAASGQAVLFGGYGASGYLSDTWTLQSGAVNIGTANVCSTGATTPSPCSQSGTLSFSVAAGTTIGSINIVTQGATGLDFQATPNDSSSTLCKAQTYTNAGTCTVDVTFAPKYAGMRNGAVTIQDGSGNVLTTAFVFGTGTAPQVAFTPGTITTIAGNGSVLLKGPDGLAIDGAGNLFVADFSGAIVQEVNASTQAISTAAGGGTLGVENGVSPTGATLYTPAGVAVDGAGNLYISNMGDSEIRKVTAGMGAIYTVAGTGTPGYSGDGGPATSAKLDYPRGISTDSAGNLYIADTINNVIREVTAATGIITTVAGNGHGAGGLGGYLGDGGPATSAELNEPFDVTVDSAGNLYIADNANNVVRKVAASTGIISTVAGNGTAGYSGDGGLATVAELHEPAGVAVDGAGNLYIADNSNDVVRKVEAVTGIISTVAGSGRLGNGGDGGPATSAQMIEPESVAVDGAGNLYIVDGGNQLIRKVAVASVPTLNYATPTNVGSVDSTDGSKTVVLSNIGNEPLTFTTLPSGSNPSYPANFPVNSSDANLCSTSAELLAGASCDVSANFEPTGADSNTGSILLTDNALNVTTSGVGSAQQSISLSGTGVQPGDTTAVTTSASAASLIYGQTVTLTATVKDTINSSLRPTGTVTFTDSANGTTTLGTVNLVNGVATYSYTPAVGTYTVTSSYTPAASSNFAPSSDTTGASFTVAAYGPLSSFSVALAQTPTYVGFADPITITPLDAEGNVVANFNGPVTLTSSDSSATFSSASYTNGVGTATVTFATTGTQSVTVAAGAVNANLSNVTVNADPAFVVSVLTDTTGGVAANCTNQNSQGATPDANCSLRDALASAAAVQSSYSGVPETITFGNITQPGTITLATGSAAGTELGLFVPSNTTVQGATSGTGPSLTNLITVDGHDQASVFSMAGASVVLKNLIITNGNYDFGGGVVNRGTLTIVQCSIVSNNSGESGGGVYNAGTLTVESSIISGNTTSGVGGGIYNQNILNLSDVTIANNSAKDGGGIYSKTPVTLSNVTISGNSATSITGGILSASTTGPTMNNSIVAGNTAPQSPDVNLPNSVSITGSGNVLGTTTMLSALGNYGGPTQTMLPQPGSPALGAGTYQTGELATDQRGYARPTSGMIDAGAVQMTGNGAEVTGISPAAGPVAGGTTVTISGTGFTGTTAVIFGNTPATSFTVNSSTSITATAPAGTVGTVDIEVVTTAGISAPVAADRYTYSSVTAIASIGSKTLTENYAPAAFTPVTGSGGTGTLTYSISPSLPAGLSFSSTNGAITGTPTVTSPSTTYMVTVTDSSNSTATASFSLMVNSAVVATQSIASTVLTENHTVTVFTPVTGTGGTGTLTYSVSPALPAGLSFSTGNGAISGTPTAASAARTYTVTVTDTNGATATASFSLTVSTPVTASSSIPSKSLTENHATTFIAVSGAGGTGTLTYNISPSLPAGLNFSTSTGVITGTPTATIAATTFMVTVTDNNGAMATASFSLTVNSAVAATQSIASAVLTENHAVTVFTPVTGTGGTGTLTYSISPALPAGLSFSTSNGAISGTPTAASTATTYTVTVTDTNGATATATFSLSVNAPVTATSAIASKSLTENHAASFTPVTGTGGTGALTYSVSPSLPAGLSISTSTGAITGTPAATIAATTFTVTVADSNGASATASFSLTVNAPVTATSAIPSKSLTQNYAASFTPVTGAGGTGTLTYSISPALPAGLTLSSTNGAIIGTPTAISASTTFTVTVTDINAATATASFSLSVNSTVVATQSIASKILTESHLAALFTPVTGTGGTGTLTYSISPSLPAGLSISTSRGAITGTPTITLAATTYTVTATDTNGATATASFRLTVNSAVVATQNTASQTLTFGQTVAPFTPVTGSGGTGTLTYSISPATLPAGLSFSQSAGTIAGTVTATIAAATYTVTVTDTNGATATANFSLTVNKASSTLSSSATQLLQLVYGQAGSIPVSVSGQYNGAGIATPGSTISYTVSGNGFAGGTAAISNGAATIAVPATVAPGTYTVTVSYAGDTNYNAATSITVSLQVGQIQPTISWAQPSAITYGASLANALNALAMHGSNTVAGTYSYLSGTTPVTASTILPAGSYTLTVNFTPSDPTTYKTATGSVALTVNKAGVSGVALTSTVNPVLVTNATTLAATVSSPVSTPTGSVSFFDGNSSTPLGSASLSGGIAQLSVSSLTVGTHAITAVYSGDTNFLGATSAAFSEQVQDFNLSISSSGSSGGTPTTTVTPGGTANYGFTLTPTGASIFPATVTLSVSGLPAGATYTITPSTIAAGAGATSVQLAVSVPSQTASLHGNGRLGMGLIPVALGMLLLPFSRRMRRTASRLGRMTALLLLLTAGAAGIAGLTGCGSNTGFFAQPQQTYNVTVTATSGVLTHSTTVTLTVQ